MIIGSTTAVRPSAEFRLKRNRAFWMILSVSVVGFSYVTSSTCLTLSRVSNRAATA